MQVRQETARGDFVRSFSAQGLNVWAVPRAGGLDVYVDDKAQPLRRGDLVVIDVDGRLFRVQL